MSKRSGKNFYTSYPIFLVCLLLIYFLFPENNLKLVAMALLPLVFFLPRDVKLIRKQIKTKNEESNSNQ